MNIELLIETLNFWEGACSTITCLSSNLHSKRSGEESGRRLKKIMEGILTWPVIKNHEIIQRLVETEKTTFANLRYPMFQRCYELLRKFHNPPDRIHFRKSTDSPVFGANLQSWAIIWLPETFELSQSGQICDNRFPP